MCCVGPLEMLFHLPLSTLCFDSCDFELLFLNSVDATIVPLKMTVMTDRL